MKKISLILLLFLSLVSCKEEEDGIIREDTFFDFFSRECKYMWAFNVKKTESKVDGFDAPYIERKYIGSRQSVWLERCAHRYGFILRYPRLKEHITGFAFEPWHYRYVGSESADIIKKSGICLEEFLNFYQDKYLFVTNRE